MEKKNKSAFRTLAEAFQGSGLKNLNLPTSRVDRRKLTVDEIKVYMKEEFGKAKEAEKVKAKEAPKGWGDAEIEGEINWLKALKLKEFFNKASVTKKKSK